MNIDKIVCISYTCPQKFGPSDRIIFTSLLFNNSLKAFISDLSYKLNVDSRFRMAEKTHLYPVIYKFVNDEFVKLRREKVRIWAFLHSARPFSCDDFFKRTIKYQGVRFEGLPRKVFWNGFIEPFLNDITFRAIDHALKLCRIEQIDAEPVVQEACGLLKRMAREIYAEMVEVDLMLCNEKNPHGSEKMDVRKHIETMDRLIDSWAEYELSRKLGSGRGNVLKIKGMREK